MSLVLDKSILQATTTARLDKFRESAATRHSDTEFAVDVTLLDDADLLDVKQAAERGKDTKTMRALDAILASRQGIFGRPMPNFKAAIGVLDSYFRHELIDGWIYCKRADGHLYPELITSITFDPGKGHRGPANPRVVIHTVYAGLSGSSSREPIGLQTTGHGFTPHDLTNRRVEDALAAKGLFKETPALRDAFHQTFARYSEQVRGGFAKQFRFNGVPARYEEYRQDRSRDPMRNHRVIHDLSPEELNLSVTHSESALFANDSGFGMVPEHPVVRVFDLKIYEYYWTHADGLTPYVYDQSLATKLVLPPSHRDLLDVLTGELDAFVGDIVEGKTAGNVILCMGLPGVGKTLTAEVYAELVERPLYMVHAGALGTNAAAIDKSLQVLFGRAERWGCAMLIDEADVFLSKRGQSLEQNAIVAEFLVALERVQSLIFLTTNRADDIDDAIVPRCAAIIRYELPGAADAARIWRVMATQYKAELDDKLIDQLLLLFPTIAPRDIKMLLRLVLRMAAHRGEQLTLETFRQCAMFRAIKMAEVDAAGHEMVAA